MEVTFSEHKHLYTVNGDIANISVTELLAKHGIGKNYKSVNRALLQEAAEWGTAIHKDLENIINGAKAETKEGIAYEKWVYENLSGAVAEQRFGLVWGEHFSIAGTADLMAFHKNGLPIIADHKTTTKVDREYVAWQVSLLDFMARRLSGDTINGRMWVWKGAMRFMCFHFDKKTHEMKIVELDKIPDSEIIKLLDCELNGEIYQRPTLVVDKELQAEIERTELELLEVARQEESVKMRAKELRSQLLELFEKQNIRSWLTPNKLLRINYVAAREDMVVDSDKLKKQFPQVYSQCQKLKKTGAYVKITDLSKED